MRVLSIDCGTKNMGWSLWNDNKLLDWGVRQLVTTTELVFQIREATSAIKIFRMDIEPRCQMECTDDGRYIVTKDIIADVLLVE
jgi:hypothetical protein